MGIDQDGFLSEQISDVQKQIREKYGLFFISLTRVNQFCQRTMLSLEVNNVNWQKIIATAIFTKILEDVQAAILLLERCALSPARSLLRVALEANIKLANICRDRLFYKAYLLAGGKRVLKIFNTTKNKKSMDSDVGEPEFTLEDFETIKNTTEKLRSEGANNSPLEQWANDVGMESEYDGDYRILSGDIHTSPDVLSHYIVANDRGGFFAFNWGPGEERQLGDELIRSGRLLLASLDSLNALFQLNLKSKLDEFLKELNQLNTESVDESNGSISE